MKLTLLLSLQLLLATFCYTQSVETLIINKVNYLRDSLGLNKLIQDKILNKAADDQSFYTSQTGKLTHFQTTFRKETPEERVAYYKGNRSYIAENVAQSTLFKISNSVIDKEKVAEQLYKAWLNSPPHYASMINPIYTKIGVGIRYTAKSAFGTQVFSTNEIKLPKAFKNNAFAWGVRPSEITCKDDKEQYETMFFANSVIEKNGAIYMAFHDIEFFKGVIAGENDGMAIDVVLREQLPCNKENQFHISKVFDGEMQEPIYKYDLFKNNESLNPEKILVKIGEVPAHLKGKQWDANVIIIQNNKLCDYSVPTEVPSDVYPLLPLAIYKEYNDGNTEYIENAKLRIKENVELIIPYVRNEENSNAFNDEIKGNTSLLQYAREIKVECFSSVEGPKWLNYKLLEDRERDVRQTLFSDYNVRSKLNFELSENWKMMYKQVEDHQLTYLQGATEEQIKYRIKRNLNAKMDSLLFEQRKTHVYAKVDTVVKAKSYEDFLLLNKRSDKFGFDNINWNKLLRETYIDKRYYLNYSLIDSLKNNPTTKTNLLGATVNQLYRLDSTLIAEIQTGVDFNNQKQLFNFANFITNYWYDVYYENSFNRKVTPTIKPAKLMREIEKLDTLLINPLAKKRLKVNVLVAGIHYYEANNNWGMTNSYFDQIADIVKSGGFRLSEARGLALFCNYFHKFDRSVDILDFFFKKNQLTESEAFILAQTATLIREDLDELTYYEYMSLAKRLNKKRYCKWLDDKFQIQRDEKLKREFCVECN